MDTQPIRFFHRGAIVAVAGAATTRTVLDWLREDAHCTGTKEGCNEGDCGACTVVIGELDEAGGLSLKPANACIRFLPTLHGKALFTVEDLKAIAGGALHPVQQALVDCHGSQCGFCTPGFVMSLWHCYERHVGGADGRRPARPTRQQLADDLSGNLCRCTGYRPILDAGQRMFDLPVARLDRRQLAASLAAIDTTSALAYVPDGHSRDEVDGDPIAGGDAPTRMSEADATRRTPRFDAPRTLAQLAELRARHPDARLLAGCTDIGLWVNKQLRDVGDLIYLGDVAELKRIEVHDDHLCIGAGASLEAAWAALAARFDGLTDIWLRFASPPIRHAGTMGGNIANGSPIGDAAPVLMALDALLELRKGSAIRRLRLDEFYLDYLKNRLEPGEFLQRLLVPLWPAAGDGPAAGGRDSDALRRHLRVAKISKRFDSDISAVCSAFAVEVDGETVRSVRLVFGGMAAVVRRATQAEAALAGRRWDQGAIDDARQALVADFQPLSDLRASSGYRMQVAQNLLQKFWLETRDAEPLPPQAASVWSVMPHLPVVAGGARSRS